MLTAGILTMASLIFWVALAIPTLVILLRVYGRTRIKAFGWLAVALVLWPFVARLLTLSVPLWLRHLASVGAPLGARAQVFGLVYLLESLVGGALVLLAVVLLERELLARMQPPPPMAPPVVGAPYER